MAKKSTEELEKILGSTHIKDVESYLEENAESILSDDRPFCDYFKELIKEKKKRQLDIFLDADIPERYGYKLLTGEKHTKQRDVILRLCYAAEFSLEETQKALKIYKMPCDSFGERKARLIYKALEILENIKRRKQNG